MAGIPASEVSLARSAASSSASTKATSSASPARWALGSPTASVIVLAPYSPSWPPTSHHSTRLRPRWSVAPHTGSARNWLLTSPSPSGPAAAPCATRATWPCVTTRTLARSSANRDLDHRPCRLLDNIGAANVRSWDGRCGVDAGAALAGCRSGPGRRLGVLVEDNHFPGTWSPNVERGRAASRPRGCPACRS